MENSIHFALCVDSCRIQCYYMKFDVILDEWNILYIIEMSIQCKSKE